MDWKASGRVYRHGRRCCGGIHFQSARGQGMYHRLIKAQIFLEEIPMFSTKTKFQSNAFLPGP